MQNRNDHLEASSESLNSQDAAPARRSWAQMGLRELLLLIVAIAFGVGWFADAQKRRTISTGPPDRAIEHIDGPLMVNYQIERGERSTITYKDVQASRLDFHPNYIVITNSKSSGRIVPLDRLRFLRWQTVKK